MRFAMCRSTNTGACNRLAVSDRQAETTARVGTFSEHIGRGLAAKRNAQSRDVSGVDVSSKPGDGSLCVVLVYDAVNRGFVD